MSKIGLLSNWDKLSSDILGFFDGLESDEDRSDILLCRMEFVSWGAFSILCNSDSPKRSVKQLSIVLEISCVFSFFLRSICLDSLGTKTGFELEVLSGIGVPLGTSLHMNLSDTFDEFNLD